ncbi:MAG: hypothetical protein ACI9CD_001073 [Candidatus Deianiraeaceae bacterium]|jgi:hypothetical protein
MTLNGLFTEELCKSKKAEIEKELKSITVEIEMHDNADNKFKEYLTTAFYLASKSYELFICSEIEEKRRLINFVFSNIQLRGINLGYTLQKPFDVLVNLGTCPNWHPLARTVRTKRREEVLNFANYLQGIQGLQLAV